MEFSNNEYKIMEMLWDPKVVDENGEITAKDLSDRLIEKYDWTKSSNYVYFSRLLDKQAIQRRYPNYTIKPLVFKETLATETIDFLIKNTFGGSVLKFFNTFLQKKEMKEEELQQMKELIDSYIK